MDCTPLFRSAKKASRALNVLDSMTINNILLKVADTAIENTHYILIENQKDLDLMDKADPKYDRLVLTAERIESIASDIRSLAGLSSPLGHVIVKNIRENGLVISKITVPFGVVGIIYEARPNVSFDVFSLCLKSGNACVLKGGTDAHNSNTAIVKVIQSILEKFGLDKNIVTLLPAGRESTSELLNATGFVDV